MVDLVFMMNIYFLVTFVTVALGGMNLPAADYCTALDADTAVIVRIVRSLDGESVTVYLGDGERGRAAHRQCRAGAARASGGRGGRGRRQDGRAAQGGKEGPAAPICFASLRPLPSKASSCTSPCWRRT